LEFFEDDKDWVNAIEMATASSYGTPEAQLLCSTPPKHATQHSGLNTGRTSHSPSPQSKFGGTKHNVEERQTSHGVDKLV
jgi:hypothetical protein